MMKLSLIIPTALHQLLCYHPVHPFIPPHISPQHASKLTVLPTVGELANDSFTKQLQHASNIIPLLYSKPTQSVTSSNLLSQLVQAQFSHLEGMRAFFQVYSTYPQSSQDDIPELLVNAMMGANLDVMIPLACENVIIPTAMKVLHQDPERQEHFRISAENGKKILRLLKGYDLVADHCMAIVYVCAGVRGEDDLIRSWERFFDNYRNDLEEEKEEVRAEIVQEEEMIQQWETFFDNLQGRDELNTIPENLGDDKLIKYWEMFFERNEYGSKEKEAIGLAIAEFT